MKKQITKTIFVTFLVSIIVGAFFVYRFINPSAKIDLKNLLPSETFLIAEINTNQLTKTFINEFILKESSTDITLNQLREKIKDQELTYPGIDFNSEIVFFIDQWEGEFIYGTLFHIKDLKAFNAFTPKEKVIKTANKKTGIIIYTKENTDNNRINVYSLKAEEILKTKSEKRAKSKEIAHFKINNNGENTQFDLFLEKESLLINGIYSSRNNSLPLQRNSHYIETKDKAQFALTTGQLPDTLTNLIETLLGTSKLEIPKLSHQQLIIYNTTVQTINKKLTILPTLDWIIQFDSDFDIEKQLKSSQLPPFLTLDTSNLILQAKALSYQFKQLAPNEVYISNNPLETLESGNIVPHFSLKGNPSVLMRLDGDGFVAKMIQMLPPVRKTQLFLEEIDTFSILTKPLENEKSTIEGEIRLREGKWFSIELLKILW